MIHLKNLLPFLSFLCYNIINAILGMSSRANYIRRCFMTEATLFTLVIVIAIRELKELLKDFLCTNKEMKLSLEIKDNKRS